MCDSAFFHDQDLLVVGGGDIAVEEALFLTRVLLRLLPLFTVVTNFVPKVFYDREPLRKKISFIWDSVVRGKSREKTVEKVVFENVKKQVK